MKTIEERIRDCIVATLPEDTTLPIMEHADLDSLGVVEVVMEIEDEFDIVIENDEFEFNTVTIADLVRIVEAKGGV